MTQAPRKPLLPVIPSQDVNPSLTQACQGSWSQKLWDRSLGRGGGSLAEGLCENTGGPSDQALTEPCRDFLRVMVTWRARGAGSLSETGLSLLSHSHRTGPSLRVNVRRAGTREGS